MSFGLHPNSFSLPFLYFLFLLPQAACCIRENLSNMDYSSSNATGRSPNSTSNGASFGSGSQQSSSGTVSSEVLASWLVIGQVCIFALCFIAVFPRAMARFSTYAEWKRGLLLTTRPPISSRGSAQRRREAFKEKSAVYEIDLNGSEDSFERTKSIKTMRRELDVGDVMSAPPSRVRSLASMLHPLSSLLMKRVAPGAALGNILLVIAYFAVIGFIAFYQTEPFTKPKRLGLVAVSQIPAVFAFASKGNLAGMLLGMGYEKVCTKFFLLECD